MRDVGIMMMVGEALEMMFDVGTRRGRPRLSGAWKHQVGYATMLVSESYKVSIEICIISLLLFTITNSTLVKKSS